MDMLNAQFFEILADPTRQHLVEALREGELTVGDLVDRVSIQQSGVSRHLRILAEAGFVSVRAEGTKRFYALRPEPFQDFSEWTDRFRWLWEKRLDRFGDVLRRNRAALTPPTKKG
jgi:DNA-binding transcriptional ArsR family regulator